MDMTRRWTTSAAAAAVLALTATQAFAGPTAAVHASAPALVMQGVSSGDATVQNVQWRGRGWRGGGRGIGWGIGAGILGGAIIGGALSAPYYYNRPYYNYPAPTYYAPPPAYAYSDGGAVDYCMRRFRSYDPASGTYLGYDGFRHPCP